MTNQIAVDVANHIQEDRQGADYYADPDVLAPYLKSSLQVSDDKAASLAKNICDDRKGADYYQDVDLLSQYLEGQME